MPALSEAVAVLVPPPIAAEPAAPPVRSDVPTIAEVAPDAAPGAGTSKEWTPWSVAADQGVIIGRVSKDAGVATAGFVSRAARRVAGAF